MKSNRRDFLRLSGLAGISMVPAPFVKGEVVNEKLSNFRAPGKHFNMSGYAAPKIETVRIGFIGLGQRGPNAVERMNKIDGVDIKALCDIRPEKAEAAKKLLNGRFNPQIYTGGKDEWKKLCERPDRSGVYRYALEPAYTDGRVRDEKWQACVRGSARSKNDRRMLAACRNFRSNKEALHDARKLLLRFLRTAYA